MANVYVGPSSAGAANGTSWANRYGTLNAAEDRPLSAGDVVYVGPGTFRELLTVDVSGTAGNPITYIGDYTGANTDGVGGIVRITGAANETSTGTRASCITGTSKDYRTFTGFLMDGASSSYMNLTSCANWIIDGCYFNATTQNYSVDINGASQANTTVRNCYFRGRGLSFGQIGVSHSSTLSNVGHIIQSCIMSGGVRGITNTRVGGVTVKNCLVEHMSSAGIIVGTALTVGQVMTINNCIICNNVTGLQATTTAEVSEDYNNLHNNTTARSNVTAGANDVAYPHHVDSRWFFKAARASGTMVTPFDLASLCALVELNSGTGAPSTDLRGAGVTGTYREWGPLEYNAALLIEGGGGVAMWPLSQSFIQGIIGAG